MLNSSQVSGRQEPSKPVTGKTIKRRRKFSSSSSSVELIDPKAQVHPRHLSASTKLAAPAVPFQEKFRRIAPSVSRMSTPIQTPKPPVPILDQTLSSSSSGGVINTPMAISSPIEQPSSSKTAPISVKIDDRRSYKTRRVTIQPGAEVVSDAAKLVPVFLEDFQVAESNVTPQSCPLEIVN